MVSQLTKNVSGVCNLNVQYFLSKSGTFVRVPSPIIPIYVRHILISFSHLCLLFPSSLFSWHRVLVGKPEGKRPLGRPRRRWEDNIKMDLREVGWVRGDWMELAQDRDRWRVLVGTVRDFRVP